jgi:flagellar biosynthesis/type III secretory pathway chaperone
MEQLINSLLLLLDDTVRLYQSLLTLYHEERQSLLAFDLEGINTNAKKKENLILKIKILEEQRQRTIDDIAALLTLDAADLSISRLAEKVDIRQAYKLSALGDELSATLNTIQEVHQSNRSLIIHSQGLVTNSLAYLGNQMTPDPVYYQNGSLAVQDQSGRLLTRTI